MTTELSTKRSGATLAEVFGGPPVDERLYQVPLPQIVPSRWQPRKIFDPEALLNLANDIRLHGVLTPLLVWPNEDGEYELIAGERRVRALYALVQAETTGKDLEKQAAALARDGFAGLRTTVTELLARRECPVWLRHVPCRAVIAPPDQLHEIAIVDNLQRADLSPLEEAQALQDLITEYGHTQRELADRLGKSQTWIAQRLMLLKLAPEVGEKVVSGEVDSATAREIARLDPAVQAAAVQHLQKHNLKSKAAQNLVQRIVEFADPAKWEPAPGDPEAALRRMARVGLERLNPAGRQAAVLAYAASYNDGKVVDAKDEYGIRRFIGATGMPGAPKDPYAGFDTGAVWQANAESAGLTCASCQLNACRAEIAAVRAELQERRVNLYSAPRCADGVTTCPAYTPAESPVRLRVPYLEQRPFPYEDAERPHIIGDPDRPDGVDDVAVWAAVIRRNFAIEDRKRDQAAQAVKNGVANALRAYVALQDAGGILVDHFLSQPCSRCIFQRPHDPAAPCQHISQPPVANNSWDNAVARTWQSGTTTIGRCRFFRLVAPQKTLPDLPGAGAALTPEAVLYLLRELTPKDYYSGAPYWIDAKRGDGRPGPAWGAAEEVLTKLLPTLTAGQRLALIYLWRAQFGWGKPGYNDTNKVTEAFLPDLNRLVPFEIAQDFCA